MMLMMSGPYALGSTIENWFAKWRNCIAGGIVVCETTPLVKCDVRTLKSDEAVAGRVVWTREPG